jgi:hypothetical protein
MINYHIELRKALMSVLPSYYEMTLNADTETPCISYMETNNYVSTNGDTLGYSYIKYQVKVWGNDIVEINNYAQQIDEVLRPLGFKRVSSGELYDRQSTMIQKILSYEALALENFN